MQFKPSTGHVVPIGEPHPGYVLGCNIAYLNQVNIDLHWTGPWGFMERARLAWSKYKKENNEVAVGYAKTILMNVDKRNIARYPEHFKELFKEMPCLSQTEIEAGHGDHTMVLCVLKAPNW